MPEPHLTAECPLCHFARRERHAYSRFHRVEDLTARPCATCGMKTIWRTGEQLPAKAVA